MAKMGRKAKPIHLHILEGNTNRLTKEEMKQRLESEKRWKAKSDKVRPPTWLDSVAKKEFKRIAGELLELEVMTNIDVNALALYCDAYADYMACTKIIQEEGLLVEYTNKAAETNKVPHPLLTKKKQLHEQMKAIGVDFGFTPSARARIVMPRAKKGAQTTVEKEFDV
ncbi:phage terminase small subunit P27 family [Bacillus cereus]|uniref:Phage terminase small subunit P27 family n=5 Tax=Bacillus cereus group TaxID=86661 RepID=A0AAW5L6U2_BACCE|nr:MULTISPECIES: phage terminase small subunit P27 family [Bacillus cereus group]MCQ6289002.1 phage terminase small subunit P27 family [Bacillus cereus]MCQ6386036.1 phage terminase small subunit P27 family [Bacillus cereus]MDM8364868.1 phage terminase small subunit P27 family [Bacillus thuringiensis]MDM8365096.1 phage terminase small subunit P27 family [Bacillus thuringiensis]HDW3058686.1 phage terminase small subunit P27 family [Bacillus cereus]